MKAIRLCIIMFLLIAVSGCKYVTEDEPPQRIQVGSTVKLNTAIEFPADSVAVYIQHGALVEANSIDSYKPYCIFEIRSKHRQPISITPDIFLISKTKYESTAALRYPMLASTARIMVRASISHLVYETELFLQSRNQPGVYRLTCKHWVDPSFARFVTLDEINNALGKLMNIRYQ